MMHNVPLRDPNNGGLEFGSFSFFEVITIRNNHAWIDSLGNSIIINQNNYYNVYNYV